MFDNGTPRFRGSGAGGERARRCSDGANAGPAKCVQGHSLCRTAGRQAALEAAAARCTMAGYIKHDEIRAGLLSAHVQIRHHLYGGPGADERGLPEPEHLGTGQCAQCPGILLDLWRRVVGRI